MSCDLDLPVEECDAIVKELFGVGLALTLAADTADASRVARLGVAREAVDRVILGLRAVAWRTTVCEQPPDGPLERADEATSATRRVMFEAAAVELHRFAATITRSTAHPQYKADEPEAPERAADGESLSGLERTISALARSMEDRRSSSPSPAREPAGRNLAEAPEISRPIDLSSSRQEGEEIAP